MNLGFNLAWELDFWGLYRRQVLAAKANLEASVENYDAVLVTLLADVSQYYVADAAVPGTDRTGQAERETAARRPEDRPGPLRRRNRHANWTSPSNKPRSRKPRPQIPAFEIQLRQAQDQLCTLLGIPPTDLQARLGQRPIPTAPREVVVGIPAQLLERRPDIRSAERTAAAQAQQIGIAQADLYPHISITGTLGYSAQNASQLFTHRPSTAASGRRSHGTSSTTAGLPTTSACRTPSSSRPCWTTAPPC